MVTREGDHRGPMSGDLVACAADGCTSKGYGVKELSLHAEGGLVVGAPDGWGVITAVTDDAEIDLYVCSPACERRLARNLTTPTVGRLN